MQMFSRAFLFWIMTAISVAGCTRMSSRELTSSSLPQMKILGIPQESTRINEGSIAVITNADFYSYKIDDAERMDCTVSADYSIPFAKSSPIYYENLTSGNYIVCVRDSFPATGSGTFNSAANLFVGTFTIDTDPPKVRDLDLVAYDRLDLDVVVSDISQPVQLVWSQVEGDDIAKFLDQSGEAVSILLPMNSKSESFAFRLDATDTAGNSTKAIYRVKKSDKKETRPALNIPVRIVTNKPSIIRSTSGGQGPLQYDWRLVNRSTNTQPWPVDWKSSVLDIRQLESLVDGSYPFDLKVTDSLGHSTTKRVEVILDREQPFVDAGQDQYKASTRKIILSGNAQDSGGVRSVQWRQVAGDFAARIVHPSHLQTEIELPSDFSGDATFSLQVVDLAGNVNYDWVSVVSDEQFPHVDIVEDVSALKPNFPFQGLRAWDKSPFTVVWHQTSGPENANISLARNIVPIFNFAREGKYQFEVKVSDAAGNVTTKRTHVTYISPNSEDLAMESNDVALAEEDEKVLVAEAKFPDIFGLNQFVRGKTRFIKPLVDLGATHYRYKWYMISGPGRLSMTKPHSIETGLIATKKGTYQIGLEIINKQGQVAKKSFSYFWDADAPEVEFSLRILGDMLQIQPMVTDKSSTDITTLWTQAGGPEKLSADKLSTDLAMMPSTLASGRYDLRLEACDRFKNCVNKNVNVNWPSNFHYRADQVKVGKRDRLSQDLDIANLPIVMDRRWQCSFHDLLSRKSEVCECRGGLCSATLKAGESPRPNSDAVSPIRHFSYSILLEGQSLYKTGLSINVQNLPATEVSPASAKELLSH